MGARNDYKYQDIPHLNPPTSISNPVRAIWLAVVKTAIEDHAWERLGRSYFFTAEWVKVCEYADVDPNTVRVLAFVERERLNRIYGRVETRISASGSEYKARTRGSGRLKKVAVT